MENLLNAYDVTLAGIAGRDQAMQEAAYGDAAQEQRWRNRLAHIAGDNMTKDQAFNEQMNNLLRGMGTGTPAQAAPAPQQPAGPPSGMDPLMQFQGQQQMPGAIMGQMAQVPGGTAQQPPDPEQQMFAALSPGGQMYQQDPMRATAKLDELKVRKSTQMWGQIQMAAEQGKIDETAAKTFNEKMEPFRLAQQPLWEQYRNNIDKGMQPAEASAAMQPEYDQMRADLAKLQGGADVVKMMPSKFSPVMFMQAKGAMAAVMRRETTEDARTAKADAAAEKRDEKTVSQIFTTPKGQPVAYDKNGKAFVDGELYTGAVVKEKAGQGTSVTVKMPDGTGGTDSFKEYTPQMKEQAFKDRNLGTYKYPTGMKSMAEKQAFDRQYYKWRVDGKISATDVTTERAVVAGNKSALQDLTKREQLVSTYVNRIEANTPIIMTALEKLKNKDSRALNVPINKLKGYMGDGDLRALKLALKSYSNEVAKVEAGSLGVAEVSQGQADEMHKIHDLDTLTMAEAAKVLAMGTKLGETSKAALKLQRQDLVKEMRGDKTEDKGHIADLSRRITSDMRGKWNDTARAKLVYHNLRDKGYSQEDIEQAYNQAEGGK